MSIDQVESPQGGLFPILKVNYTSRKYHVATIFVDHFSKLIYVHFNKSTTANKSVEAKHAFEEYAATFGLKFKNTMLTMVPSILEFSKKA